MAGTLSWASARAAAYAAGRAAMPTPTEVPLAEADGLALGAPLSTLTDLPAFPTSSVDGYATRGEGPWRVVGQVLAGSVAPSLHPGDALQIATGAMVPTGTDSILRLEDATVGDDQVVRGEPRPMAEWREPGDEATKGEALVAAGCLVTPAVTGLAAACGYDRLAVVPAARTAVVIFGDELLTEGLPGMGRVRDALGPQLPGWLRRLGAPAVSGFNPRGPVEDTLEAHIAAISQALEHAPVVCTTGGTMHGPVDHLHPALAALGAEYIANTVAVRPGFPMLLARIARAGRPDAFVAGLPGNPQSAIVALVSLVMPLLRGLAGRPEPAPEWVRLGEAVPGRGEHTHLALVRIEASSSSDRVAFPLAHSGSAMLRGLAQSDGFAVIDPGVRGDAGARVPFVALPLLAGDLP